MDAQPVPLQLPAPAQLDPSTERIRKRLLQNGVVPTPKILRNILRKQIQKHNRKLAKTQSQALTPPLTHSQQQALVEEQHFQTLKREYKRFNRAVAAKTGDPLVGKPWERIERLRFRELAAESREFVGDNLKRENLRELKEMFEKDLNWVLDNDIELEAEVENVREWDPAKRWKSEAEAIRVLVDRLSEREMTVKNWKFVRIMKQSGLVFTEGQLLKIVEELGRKGSWKQAMSIVEWVYGRKERRYSKSRFVYTKLLAVLGRTRRPREALHIFNLMLEDCSIYPDMAAYHSAAVTLGQAGFLKELMKLIERMREKSSRRIKNMWRRNFDPVLEPDVVVYNAVLNACVPSQQWKGVFWVFKQLRKSSLKPNGATYGLAMEVMLQSGKYDLVHKFFKKMKKSGEGLSALTYKVLVRAFWEEGRINEAVEVVRDMEQRGVVGTAGVYYELACCLCNSGRWQDAMIEVEKMKKLRHTKPLEVTFTGLIMSSRGGGHVDDCISIFQRMKEYCEANIGTVNVMLKVYGQNDMFSKAKELFEDTLGANSVSYGSLSPDVYTYSSMLEASATAQQWEYFEYVYKGMALSGYQLDQAKHAWLLVEASKAGKWHLLEHAFDALLEAGEIPHPMFFTEMLIQATAQSNYEKAVNLVNTVAHAPFQVSEKQWTDLFEKNGDRITRDNLEKLLHALCNCNLSSEATVSNLSKTLHTLCGLGKEKDSSNFTRSGCQTIDVLRMEGNNEGFDINRTENVQSSYASMAGGNVNVGADSLINRTEVPVDIHSVNHSGADFEDDNQLSRPFTALECSADDAELGEYSDFLENELSKLYLNGHSEDDDELEVKVPSDEVGDPHGTELPTANEILETWKESQKKDGIFLPFELGKK